LKKNKTYTFFNKSILTGLLSLFIFSNNFAQKYTEYEVKAVFLVNFGKFVELPENNSKNIIFGIYGTDPFGEIFQNTSFKNTLIKGKTFNVKKFNSLDEIKCDILFVSGINKYEMIQLLSRLKNKPVLTVGDNLDEFCEKGGMINFTEKGNRYRFEINNNAALNVNIKISSKLLNLAKIITVNEVKF